MDAQNAGNGISGLQISKRFRGIMPPDPPPYSCMVCRPHTWPFAIAIPSNILSHRKVPFQKCPPPHGKILKKGPASWTKDGVRIGYTGYEEGLLSLRNISKTARRTYKCVAQRHTLTDEISIEIIIQYCISILIISLRGLFFLPKCFNLE